jgi:hypothetical protein
MASFTKFDPRKFVKSECDEDRSGLIRVPTLAILAALAGVPPQTEKTRILESIPSTNLIPGEEKREWTPPPAKLAKAAKDMCVPDDRQKSLRPVRGTRGLQSQQKANPHSRDPCAARRGRVEQRDCLFLHFCAACGAWELMGMT